MNTIVVATTAADSAAFEAVTSHHAELSGALKAHVDAVIASAETAAADPAPRRALVDWCDAELVPHALAEEKAMYPSAHQDPTAKLLVDAMIVEHQVLISLVDSLRGSTTPVRAAADAHALRVLFESHVTKENDQILPLLAGSSGGSLADILGQMHQQLEEQQGQHSAAGAEGTAGAAAAAGQHADGSACGCGESDAPGELPELDARVVPHKIRHATVLGALDTVQSGGGIVLVAPHDPLPLLRQIEQRFPAAFEVDYLERGPEAWRLRFLRH